MAQHLLANYQPEDGGETRERRRRTDQHATEIQRKRKDGERAREDRV